MRLSNTLKALVASKCLKLGVFDALVRSNSLRSGTSSSVHMWGTRVHPELPRGLAVEVVQTCRDTGDRMQVKEPVPSLASSTIGVSFVS